MIYLQLFISFIQVGLFSIGGGYAAIPLIQSEVVTLHGWLSMAEFTNLITIAEMTPGPIAVNSATFVGIRIAGFPGAVVATLGCILPSCIIVSLLAYVYHKYRNLTVMQSMLSSLRPAIVALIASAGLSIFLIVAFEGNPITIANIEWIGVVITITALITFRKLKCNPILIIGLSGIAGLVMQLLTEI